MTDPYRFTLALDVLHRAAQCSDVNSEAVELAAHLLRDLVAARARRAADLAEVNRGKAITDEERELVARRWIEYTQRTKAKATQRGCAAWIGAMDDMTARRARTILGKILATPTVWPLSDPSLNTSDGVSSEHGTDGPN